MRDLLLYGSNQAGPELGYGLLYNWFAATDSRGVAPSGFRVPAESDYDTLLNNFNAEELKSERTSSDGDPFYEGPPTATPGTNTSGFTAVPSGIRTEFGAYTGLRRNFYGWASDELSVNNGSRIEISTGDAAGPGNKKGGVSIRCVSDSQPASSTVQDNDGNNYTWVQIGSQYWLQQSLKTTSYNNGDSIPTGLDNTAWSNTTNGAWAYPDGDSSLPI